MVGDRWRLSAELADRCDGFAADLVTRRLMGDYPEAARAAIVEKGCDWSAAAMSRARRAECAFALRVGLDPLEVLNWSTEESADPGFDLLVDRLRVDVKSTKFGGRFLLWPRARDGGGPYCGPVRFQALGFVRGAGREWEIVGWISARAFLAGKRVADDRSGLLPGTWYLEARDLWPMADFDGRHRAVQVARRCGTVDAFVRGEWP